MAVEMAPQLRSPEAVTQIPGEGYGFDVATAMDPDDPIVAAELAREFNFDEITVSSAFEYFYKDGATYSVYTDPSTREKTLVSVGDSLDGEMLAAHSDALQAIKNGLTTHEASAVLVTENEEDATYITQVYERVDEHHVKVSSRMETVPKDPLRQAETDRVLGALDGSTASDGFDALMTDFSDFAAPEQVHSQATQSQTRPKPVVTPGFIGFEKPAPADSSPQSGPLWEVFAPAKSAEPTTENTFIEAIMPTEAPVSLEPQLIFTHDTPATTPEAGKNQHTEPAREALTDSAAAAEGLNLAALAADAGERQQAAAYAVEAAPDDAPGGREAHAESEAIVTAPDQPTSITSETTLDASAVTQAPAQTLEAPAASSASETFAEPDGNTADESQNRATQVESAPASNT